MTKKKIDLVKSMTKNQVENTKLNEPNTIGQVETWMDPVDAINNPAYSRVVTNAEPDQFLQKNLKALLKCKYEYYSYIGGKCLFGTCICGQCKCVHFKFNSKNG